MVIQVGPQDSREVPPTDRAFNWRCYRDADGHVIGYAAQFQQKDKGEALKLAKELYERGISRGAGGQQEKRDVKLDFDNYYVVRIGITKPTVQPGGRDYEIYNYPRDDVEAFRAWAKDHGFFQAMREAESSHVVLNGEFTSAVAKRRSWAPAGGGPGVR